MYVNTKTCETHQQLFDPNHYRIILIHQRGAGKSTLEKPQDIVFIQACKNRSEATKRELELKKFNKNEKLQLIKSKT